MTASEERAFTSLMNRASGLITLAASILKDTHERSDVTRRAARRLDDLDEWIQQVEDQVLEDSATASAVKP